MNTQKSQITNFPANILNEHFNLLKFFFILEIKSE